jgi:hypothetical protein
MVTVCHFGACVLFSHLITHTHSFFLSLIRSAAASFFSEERFSITPSHRRHGTCDTELCFKCWPFFWRERERENERRMMREENSFFSIVSHMHTVSLRLR